MLLFSSHNVEGFGNVHLHVVVDDLIGYLDRRAVARIGAKYISVPHGIGALVCCAETGPDLEIVVFPELDFIFGTVDVAPPVIAVYKAFD